MDSNNTQEAYLYWKNYLDIIDNFEQYHDLSLPLCAAETSMSDFAKIPLNTSLQERYINGSVLSHTHLDNFIGSEHLFPLYENISELCKVLFRANLVDPRPLSGMNATTTVLLTSLNIGDKIAVLSPSGGGHDSFATIVNRLGFDVYEAPFDFSEMKVDIDALNKLIVKEDIKAVLLAPSDIVSIPRLEKIDIGEGFIIYDATQTLGLIASGLVDNPLDQNDRVVIVGGTHKTLPGPTCGIILTNLEVVFSNIDKKGSIYVRNPQPHQIASLMLTLIEFMVKGKEYSSQILANANSLANILYSKYNIDIIKPESLADGKWTETHQLFLHFPEDIATTIERNAIKYGVTLNRKTKKIFKNTGIRLGLQEITRLGWKEDCLPKVAKILDMITRPNVNDSELMSLLKELPVKDPNHYSYRPQN